MVELKNNNEFNWVPFFKEMGNILLQYEAPDKQKELVQFLKNAGIQKGLTTIIDNENNEKELEYMDPFSFASIICRFGEKRVLTILESIKKDLSLKEPIPKSLNGLPSSPAMNSWLFAYERDMKLGEYPDDYIEILWRMFKNVHNENLIEKEFDTLLKPEYKGVGKGKLTHGLFRFFPEKFLPVDSKTILFFKEDSSIDIDFRNYQDYYKVCKDIQKMFPNKYFYELSYLAHKYSLGRTRTEDIVFLYCDDKNKNNIELYDKHIKNTFIKDNVIFKELDDLRTDPHLEILKDCSSAILLLFFNFSDKNNTLKIINELKINQIPFRLLIASEDYALPLNLVNLKELEKIKRMRREIEEEIKTNIISFNSDTEALERLNAFIIDKEENKEDKRIPLKLHSLEMDNIGIFKNTTIQFDDQFTAIIGLNGTGKTTLLKSIILAIIGNEYLDDKLFNELKKLLTIRHAPPISYEEQGKINLNFKRQNNLSFHSTISFEGKDSIVNIKLSENNLNDEHKTLLIGFGQQRGNSSPSVNKNEATQEHLNVHINTHFPDFDFLPLLNNDEEGKIVFFYDWLKGLYKQINEGYKKKEGLINKFFEIFKDITGKNILFYSSPNESELYIEIHENEEKKVVPLMFASQGFQYIMSIVGYILLRMYNYYGEIENFNKEHAIVILDEIDTYLHPRWLLKFPEVLQKHFPNVQFIVTTHSPIILTNLKRDQVWSLKEKGKINEAEATRINFNPYGMDIIRILNYFMDNTPDRNITIREKIDKLYEYIDSENWKEAESIIQDLDKEIEQDDPEYAGAKAFYKMGVEG